MSETAMNKTRERMRAGEARLTAARLREVLAYDPASGNFTWRDRVRKMPAGTVAGSLVWGYLVIAIDNRKYQAHRLVWLYMTGGWPPDFIDHVDRDKGNNRWENLRLATHAQNMANLTRHPLTKSRLKGVDRYAGTKRWRARISVNGARVSLGHFDTAEQAYEAYCRAAREFYGEFARTA